MYTIGEVGKMFNLSRSSLLYYDKIGLLKPTERKSNKYRLYDETQIKKLEKIIMYRESGVSLEDIQKLLDNSCTNDISSILISRLENIQEEIKLLKKQELLIIDVLKNQIIYDEKTDFTPALWSELLTRLGYNAENTLEWHKNFEKEDSLSHRKFLKSLKMTDMDIENLLFKLKI